MRKAAFFFIAIFLVIEVSGQEIGITGSVEWEGMDIHTSVALRLASVGIRLPTGRAQAEELISTEYPRLVRPSLLSIPVDSSNTVEDLINSGEFSLRTVGSIALSAKRIPPALSTDLAFLTANYTIDLTRIGAALIRHSAPMEVARPLRPIPAAAYTGIIIIANEALPIHGRNAGARVLPCLFPKVWDTEMNLIYERNMLYNETAQNAGMVRYVSEESIFRPTPSGLSPELSALVGNNPLRIIARAVYGIRPTDPIIDRQDALTILSSDANIRLLREGRVALVLHRDVLRNPITSE
ncbi:putative OmpA family protein [Treponema primitia ZAS-2]|uniref:Putative OmpA family protein n=1 Tax=Treponema primitia (strain ATCC BAA-887 / DSM 12427 / ZAS-2) TaxID=545694 RepID=F5YPG5_TREPZ|nr:hypothetical protein [Treponema primitia]AEF84064.1 putative OmpA family protein [Treponema primitia ZAS-2]